MLQNKFKRQILFRCTIKIIEKMIKFLVHYYFIEISKGVIKFSASRPFNVRIHREMLTWTQLLFDIHIFHFVEDIFRINICSPDEKAMLGVFMLTWSVYSWKLWMTMFTLERNDKFWGAVSFWYLNSVLGFCGEIGAFNQYNNPTNISSSDGKDWFV